MASPDDVFFVETQNFSVPTGGTLQVGITGGVGVNNILFKHISGGTLWIRGWTGQAFGTGYLTSYGEAVSLGGPTEYWIEAQGATASVCLIRGKTAGIPTVA